MGRSCGTGDLTMTTTEGIASDATADVASTLRPLPAPDPEVAGFLYLEARLADEGRYSEWELLWAADALYWVPMHPDTDPRTQLSCIYDNRNRIKSRVAQLNTGNRHSQTPAAVVRRMLSNMEVLESTGDTVTVGSNFAVYEYRHTQRIWAGRVIHKVRRTATGLELVAKTVHLVGA